MSTGLNKTTLIGNLGKDPEVRRTHAGKPIVSFSLATSESWRNKDTNERQEKTEWHNIVIFNEGLAKVAEQYLRKGMRIYLEGKNRTRKWKDQSGADRSTTEVVIESFSGTLIMLDKVEGGGRSRDDDRGYDDPRPAAKAKSAAAGGASLADDLNDEIPFSCEWR